MAEIEDTETTEDAETTEQAESQDSETEAQAADASPEATQDAPPEVTAAEPPAEAVAATEEPAVVQESKPAPAPPAAPVPADKGPLKAKLKELKAQRNKALQAGDGSALKLVRARIRRLKRQLRKAG